MDRDLRDAAGKGQQQRVKELLAAGADVNAVDPDTQPALHAAATAGHHGIVQMLLEAGADVHAVDTYDSTTPLYAAAQAGHHDVVKLLLDAGADVNAALPEAGDPEYESYSGNPLYAAAASGNLRAVQLLLAAGADINAASVLDTPLCVAATHGHFAVVQLLLDAGAHWTTGLRVTSSSRAPLSAAARYGHLEVVQLLLCNAVSPQARAADSALALQVADLRGHNLIVELLLEACQQPGVTATDLAEAAKEAVRCHHLASYAWLARELRKLYPEELQQLGGTIGHTYVSAASAVAAVLDEWASDVSSLGEQRAAVHKREEAVAQEQQALQQLIVGVAGIARAAQQGATEGAHAQDAVAAVLGEWASSGSSLGEQRAAVCKREEDVVQATQAMQQLTVGIVGASIARQAQEDNC